MHPAVFLVPVHIHSFHCADSANVRHSSKASHLVGGATRTDFPDRQETQLALAASGHLGYQDALTKVVAEDSDEEGEEGEEGEEDELDLGGAGTDDGDSSDDDAE